MYSVLGASVPKHNGNGNGNQARKHASTQARKHANPTGRYLGLTLTVGRSDVTVSVACFEF